MAKHKRSANANAYDGLSGGIFMIGLGILFLVDGIDFWPWILVLIGITSLPSTFGRGDYSSGLHSLLWMIGLAILFSSPGLFWPGILVLIGLSIIVDTASKPARRKAKRGNPGRAGLDDIPDDELDYTDGMDDRVDMVDEGGHL